MYARDMYTMYLSISISTRRQDAAGQDRSGALRRGRMPCLHWCCRLTTGCALLGCTSCSRAPWEGSPARPSVCSGLGAVSPRHTGRGCSAGGASAEADPLFRRRTALLPAARRATPSSASVTARGRSGEKENMWMSTIRARVSGAGFLFRLDEIVGLGPVKRVRGDDGRT
jgi:hypothetical protein